MNASLVTADRATHVRILSVGLVFAMFITWLAIALH